jgi:signal transduction histidine kinase
MDMDAVARQAVEEVAAASPKRVVQISTSGELHGSWDAPRISQVLVNLLSNAVQYGEADKPVTATVRGEAREVVLTVHNCGPAIAPSQIARLFDPVKRLKDGEAASTNNNLGLGLYIAERIVIAHGGTIEVKSSEKDGTVFTVRLPR